MNTIVMNTLTGAVSEYDTFDFQSITPTHAGSAIGLFQLGGDLDVAAPIAARVVSGKVQWGSSVKFTPRAIFFAMKGAGTGEAIVKSDATEWTYPVEVQDNGESRAIPGRGIRENYLAFGYANVAGADFQLDGYEVVENQSVSRRT